ncbi:MAG: TetR/AcrR family transcriptional regulator [Holdemanella sp.]|nr:TetR/AcrR family transcriptional regulator [Holdemanella sp.]
MYRDVKKKIINTAYELFQKHGYEKTTIMDICKECGITKTTFYRYIASKEDILTHFFDDITLQANHLLAQRSTSEDYYEQLSDCFQIIIDQALRFGPDLYAQLYVSNIKENRGTFKMNHHFNELVIEIIRKGQERGQFQNKTDARMLFETLADLCFGCGIRWCLSKGYDDFTTSFKAGLAVVVNLK